MNNDRNIEFTPASDMGATARDIEFNPSPTLSGADGQGSQPGSSEIGQGMDQGRGVGMGSGSGMGSAQGMTAAAGEATERVRDAAQNAVSTVQERATEQVTSRLEAQKHMAAESLSNIAQTLRSSSEQLQSDGLGRYIVRAADEVEHLAHYLDDREVGEIMHQVEDFARRQPAAFVGGAFALGLLGARFLKSSGGMSRHRHDLPDRTGRVHDPERDAVGRPGAPGYAAPSERAPGDFNAAARRME